MKYLATIIIILISILISCNKYKNVQDDTSGNQYLRGRLFLTDTLIGNGDTLPLTGKTIYLSYKSDSSFVGNFLFSTPTDSNGYFIFQSLLSDSFYRLRFSDTVMGLVYYADTVLKAGNDSLPFIARANLSMTTGFEYIFKDSLNQGALPGIKACVFTSAILAYSDTCLGSTYSLVSDNYGRVFQFGIPPGAYYILITANYPTLQFKQLDSFTVTKNNIYLQTMQLP